MAGLLGDLAAATSHIATHAGHVPSGPTSPQHAPGRSPAPNRTQRSGASARIQPQQPSFAQRYLGSGASAPIHPAAYRQAVISTYLHQSARQQQAIVKGALARPSLEGSMILQHLGGAEAGAIKGLSARDVSGGNLRVSPEAAAKMDWQPLRSASGWGPFGTATAPVVKVLSQLSRPVHAIAGASDALVQGKSLGTALSQAEKGLIENKPYTFSDVLKHAGVGGPAASIGGFALDVAADPTTYATLGAGPVAEKLAAKEAQRITAKATKAGMPAATAQRLGQVAAKRVLAKAPQNKGLRVGARGGIPFTYKRFNVQTSGRTTAALARHTGVTRAGTAVRNTPPVQALGKAFVHDFRAKDITPQEHAVQQAALREFRAAQGTSQRVTSDFALALQRAEPDPAKQQQILDALEHQNFPAGKVGNIARKLEAQFKYQKRTKNAAGIPTQGLRTGEPGEAKGYFPHVLQSEIKPNQGISRVPGTSPTSGLRMTTEQARQIRTPLSTQRLAVGVPHVGRLGSKVRGIGTRTEPMFSENVPAVFAHAATDTGRRIATANVTRRIASLGRDVKPGQATHLSPHEAVYKVDKHGLTPVQAPAGSDFGTIWKPQGEFAGKFVVLNKHLVAHVEQRLKNTSVNDSEFLQWLDRLQGHWRKAVTVMNPSYHGRNLIGDTLNALSGGATGHSFQESARLLKALHARNAARSTAENFTHMAPVKVPELDRTLKVGNQTMTYGDLIKEAERNGAIRTGFAGAEIRQLTGEKVLTGKGKVKRNRLRGVSEYREDLPRLASYLSARKAGMTPGMAAEHSLKHLFDYGNLTPTERQLARRMIPFYTFFARNTRLQVSKLIMEPGKLANLQKALEETAKAAGFSSYQAYTDTVPQSQQRGLPFPIRVNGKVYNGFVSPPATDLNQLTANPGDLALNIANRLSFFKVIPELAANYSLFFGKQIQNPQAPRVPAPMLVADLPAPLKKLLGVQKILDKRSGKMIWGWFAKADYIARQLPQTNTGIQLFTSAEGSRGLTPATAAIGLTGVKITPNRPLDTQVNLGYGALAKAANKLGDLRQRGLQGTPQYQQALVQQRQVKAHLDSLKRQRGDKIVGRTSSKNSGYLLGSGTSSGGSGSGGGYLMGSGSSSGSGGGSSGGYLMP